MDLGPIEFLDGPMHIILMLEVNDGIGLPVSITSDIGKADLADRSEHVLDLHPPNA